MQAEIDSIRAAHPSARLIALPVVRILGINAAGAEAGNDGMTAGRSLPWLQDTDSQDVWGKWDVTWRDVFILDQNNRHIDTYNLTQHNLADSTNYATLRAKLLNLIFPAVPPAVPNDQAGSGR